MIRVLGWYLRSFYTGGDGPRGREEVAPKWYSRAAFMMIGYHLRDSRVCCIRALWANRLLGRPIGCGDRVCRLGAQFA